MRSSCLPRLLSGWCLVAIWLMASAPASAADWIVAPGGTGNGTPGSPFGQIQAALTAAQPGDTVTVRAGTYQESLRTVRDGAMSRRIVVKADGARGSVVVTAPGRVLTVSHAYVTVSGLVLDGQYGRSDTVDVTTGGNHLTLRDTEVRRSSRDLIDIDAPQGVTIDGCLVHHALNAVNGRTDAHGIAAGAVRDLLITNTEIHTFSGDAFQVDPGRSAPGWTRVTIDRSTLWLAPLPAAENGFAAGTVPGENAVDTKASSLLTRASITIRDTIARGFGNGLIANMAAFNLKENIEATVDRVTVSDSEIAFRLRGPTSSEPAGARVTIKNAVIYNTGTAFRYENNIEQLRIWNSTLGAGVTRAFEAASSARSVLDVRNLLSLNPLPAEANHASNLRVRPDAFVDAAGHDYELASRSDAIDRGTPLSEVAADRAGTPRPQGAGYDVGAFERRR